MNSQQQIPGSYMIKKKCNGDNKNNTKTVDDHATYFKNDNNNTKASGECKQDEGNKYPIEIEQIKSEILTKFETIYNQDFATKLLLAFDKVITEEAFDEIELIADDFEDPSTSAILDSIWDDIEQYLQHPINDKKKIIKGLQDIISAKYKAFNIKNFTFTVHQYDVNQATKLAEAVASNIYGNSGKRNGDFQKKMNINTAEDKSLCISKAVDIKNRFPISKWLLDSFSRDRIINHKILFEKFSGNIDEYPFHSDRYCTGYNATTWWLRDSTFCKYIQYKNTKMALPLMTAIQALSKRVLPQLHFNSQLSPVIYDNLNDIIKYILAFWSVAHTLVTNNEYFTEGKHDEIMDNEAQIDCWIIPQLVKQPLLNSFLNYDELFGNNNNNNDIEAHLNFVIGNNCENKCNKLGKSSFMNKVKYPLWNLEEILKKSGYVQNEDYWVQYAGLNLDKITDKFNKMLQYVNDNKFIGKRYIFIVDRRDPENLKQQNMGLKQPNYFKGKTQDFADKIYLIIPKEIIKTQTNKLNNLQLIPEIYWSRSKEFLFPNGEEKEEPIGITDTLNGYKFVFSFHLKKYNSCSVYWYSDCGSIKFELQDMKWLLNRYFCKINNKKQKLNDENLLILEEWMKEKQLNDYQFDQFRTQSNAMLLIYDK